MIVRRGGAPVAPGRNTGDVLTWDGTKWTSAPVPVPTSGPTIVNGDTIIYTTIGGITYAVPASLLPSPANASLVYDIFDLNALSDGSEIGPTPWPNAGSLGGNMGDPGAGARPIMGTDALTGTRFAQFDGVNDFLRQTGFASPADPRFTVFWVNEYAGGQAAAAPAAVWGLGRAGLVDGTGVGTMRGAVGAASFAQGVIMNPGGATLHSCVGSTVLDGASSQNQANQGVRRAYAAQGVAYDNGRRGLFLFRGHDVACFDLEASPGTNVDVTYCILGANGNGGGAPTNFQRIRQSFLSAYFGAASAAISHKQVWMELEKLRGRYACH